MYRFRNQNFSKLTEDHSILQEQINLGLVTISQAKNSVNKNLVTRALGVNPVVELELNEFDVEVNDIYLLCSDGLSDLVDDNEIFAVLNDKSLNLDYAAQSLVQLANENGGYDNISIILIKVKESFEYKRTRLNTLVFDYFLGWLKSQGKLWLG
jgi:protein phosphatase